MDAARRPPKWIRPSGDESAAAGEGEEEEQLSVSVDYFECVYPMYLSQRVLGQFDVFFFLKLYLFYFSHDGNASSSSLYGWTDCSYFIFFNYFKKTMTVGRLLRGFAVVQELCISMLQLVGD